MFVFTFVFEVVNQIQTRQGHEMKHLLQLSLKQNETGPARSNTSIERSYSSNHVNQYCSLTRCQQSVKQLAIVLFDCGSARLYINLVKRFHLRMTDVVLGASLSFHHTPSQLELTGMWDIYSLQSTVYRVRGSTLY